MPQPELPAYLAQMDVCLNVFRAGALSKDVSPLKFYEYLATGKPIVSTREPLQVEDFKDVVYIAQHPEMFLPLCDAAAKGKPSGMDGKTPCLRRAVLVDRARAPDGRGALQKRAFCTKVQRSKIYRAFTRIPKKRVKYLH